MAPGPWGDRLYGGVTTACALAIPALLLALGVVLVDAAWPALRSAGWQLLFGTTWDIGRGQFGALPALLGTVASAAIALAIASPLALAVSIVSSELAPPAIRAVLAFLIDLLAAIPSVVYGLWGLLVLVPLLRQHAMPALAGLPVVGRLPLFAGPAYGVSLLAAGLVLAIMVLPYIAAVGREVLAAVPVAQRESALALGATRWETIRDAVLPNARSGLVGGVMLGLGRALGETMAVTLVIGNRHAIPDSLFAPSYTLAALLANEFAEASSESHLAALAAVALLLLGIALVVNVLARWLVARVARGGIRG